MRLWWHVADYVSHARAARAYRRAAAAAGLTLVDDPAAADLCVLHEDPVFWPALLARFPALRGRPRVGYAVWEAEVLSPAHAPHLPLVHAVWTASHFSAQGLRQGHPWVEVLPHVVEPLPPSAADLAWARQRVGEGPYFLAVTDSINPRKNLPALLRAFARVRRALGGARLVVKHYRQAVDLSGLPDVVGIAEDLADGQLAALMTGAVAVVSPHRAEAWGLVLSEAMALGAAVVATGWSGNLEFMDDGNAVLLPYRLVPVGQAMAGMLPHFTPAMRWAEVDEAALGRALVRLARLGPDPAMTVRAQAVAERFAPATVGARLRRLAEAAVAASRGVTPHL